MSSGGSLRDERAQGGEVWAGATAAMTFARSPTDCTFISRRIAGAAALR
jgi:hypothetical protein